MSAPAITHYRGRNIATLSREELIEALELAAQQLEQCRTNALSMNRAWAAIARELSSQGPLS